MEVLIKDVIDDVCIGKMYVPYYYYFIVER